MGVKIRVFSKGFQMYDLFSICDAVVALVDVDFTQRLPVDDVLYIGNPGTPNPPVPK
jgi:hypothetical protein